MEAKGERGVSQAWLATVISQFSILARQPVPRSAPLPSIAHPLHLLVANKKCQMMSAPMTSLSALGIRCCGGTCAGPFEAIWCSVG